VRLRRGIKARGYCLVGHHEVRGRAARGGRRGQKKAARVSWRGGEDTSDRWGSVDREMRERWPAREGVNRKGKRISCEDATDARAGWAGRVISAYEDGAADGQAASARPKIRKKEISELKLDF
jgi:hypothetical protein